MTIGTKVDTFDWERGYDLFDDELVMNIVENDLSIKTYRAHKKFVQRTKTQAFHMPGMFIELSHNLFGLSIIEAHGTMICHCTKHIFLQMTELGLVNRACIVLTSKL